MNEREPIELIMDSMFVYKFAAGLLFEALLKRDTASLHRTPLATWKDFVLVVLLLIFPAKENICSQNLLY